MPKRTPKNTYWRGPVLWGCITVRGKDLRWSLRTNDPKVAQRRVVERREREVAFSYYGEVRRSYEETVAAWAAWIRAQVAPSTAKRYACSLEVLAPSLRGHTLVEIDTRLIGEIVRGRQAGKISNATIRRDLTALSSVLGYGEAMEWCGGNPALAWLRRLRERRDPIILPEPDHIRRVIARAPGMFARLIECAWLTGARLEELANARRSQLDHARKQLTLVGKGNKLRVIDLDGWGYDVLRSLPAALGGAHLFWHHGGNPYRNISSRFASMVGSELRRAIAEASAQGPDARPNFRPFRFHDLRHRHAVDWLKAGRSIYDLQQRLGHSSIKTTEIYLAYLTPDEIRSAKYGTNTK